MTAELIGLHSEGTQIGSTWRSIPAMEAREMTAKAAVSSSSLRVPDDISELDQWVLWRFESRNGKPTKVPYQTCRKKADITDPATWTTFDQARMAWSRNSHIYAGLGFVFSKQDSFAGIDLDNALGEFGDVKAWARGVVEQFSDSYSEISPSGKGLKIWARGALPGNLPGVKIQDGSIEMYDHSRYFAVTGRAFRGAPLEVEDHAADLLRLYERLAPSRRGWPLQPPPGGMIPHGRQHNTLVSLCGTLRARRICEPAILACLQVVNEKQCERPGTREGIVRMVQSTRGWGPR